MLNRKLVLGVFCVNIASNVFGTYILVDVQTSMDVTTSNVINLGNCYEYSIYSH